MIPISVVYMSVVSNLCCDLSCCFILVIICVVLPQIKTDLVGGGEQIFRRIMLVPGSS